MGFVWATLIVLEVWFLFELFLRVALEWDVRTDFYGSITFDEVHQFQEKIGVRHVCGMGWVHLGWIADPERETYLIQFKDEEGDWVDIAKAQYGSWLGRTNGGEFRVVAVNKINGTKRVLGEQIVHPDPNTFTDGVTPVPVVTGRWKPIFKPVKSGSYINGHCLYQDRTGQWRLIGTTGVGRGKFLEEKYFAVGVGEHFPPQEPYHEEEPIGDVNDLARAPDVIKAGETYHLFWSPNKLHHMISKDGVQWKNHKVVINKPQHKFFRDAKIVEIAPNQWLLYASGRGLLFSRIDIYQSFDLEHWQYIRPAVVASWGSEKNSAIGSMESPFLIKRKGNYYLSVTYNHGSFFWSTILMFFKVFINKKDYNNTLIFHADNPYDFGPYRGAGSSSHLIAQLQAHAPVYLRIDKQWYMTTCGWPFAATLTEGEVAWAPLNWQERPY